MSIKITTVCPLGCECEKAVEGGIERCAWYVKLRGQDPQSGSDIDEWRCSMAWQPILMIEGNSMANKTASSIQSFRNETVARQEIALGVITNAKTITSK